MTLLTDLTDANALLALSAEDLAPIALRTLVEGKKEGLPMHESALGYRIFERERHVFEARFPGNRRKEIETLFSETLQVLLSERLVVPEPGYNGKNGFVVLTPRGSELLANEKGFRGFKGADAMPKGMLHPTIADVVWKALARGDLENGVLEAFKAVEIAVREAGKFEADDVGVDLMRKAFDPKDGPLTDTSLPKAERVALAHLFAGAIGYYKNPQSHREAKIGSQRRAQEIVVLATQLLHVVDERRAAAGLGRLKEAAT